MCIPAHTTTVAPFLATPYEFKVIAAAERAATPYSALEELAARCRAAIAGSTTYQRQFDGLIQLILANLPESVEWTGRVTTGTALRAAQG